MKRLVQAVFFLVCAIAIGVSLYYLIRERAGAAAASRPIAERGVVVAPEEGSAESSAAQEERDAAINRIAALPNEIVLDVATFNFDQDEGEEQILTVRKTDRKDGRLSVVLADYLPQRRGWARTWEAETLTTKPTTFALQAMDMIGDHVLDIVCTGMDESGQQTISIFRRQGSGEGPLTYSTICEISADAVAVDEVERGEGYNLGQTSGASWNILAYRSDKNSPNILDQIKETWSWDGRKGAYSKVAETAIPGAQVERDIVSRILTGSEKDFENFLEGVWVESGKAATDPRSRMLVFDRAGSSITFYTGDAQEIFAWIKSDPTRYGLYARCRNVTVESLIRLMDIELAGADSISVRIFEDLQMKVDPENRWDGSYVKLRRGAQAASRAVEVRTGADLKLEGPYRTADGSELSFARPNYILKRGEGTERGYFGVYRLGADTVLDLSAMNEDGFSAGRKTFRAAYSEQKSGKDLVRRLVLTPARAAISGLETLEEPNLVFEQRIRG